MTTFTITIQDQAVQSALKALADRATNLGPVMGLISARMQEDTQRRFETGTGPDGQLWKKNTAATLEMLSKRLAKSYRKKNGEPNSRGVEQLSNKKPLNPLHGTPQLKNAFNAYVSERGFTLVNSKEYAAIHQFGGTTGANSWTHGAKITARPFLPIKPDGTLYPQEQATVLDELNNWLINGR